MSVFPLESWSRCHQLGFVICLQLVELNNLFQWSFGGGSLNHSRETVNTAIVDFYQQGDEEPVLKSRVSSCSSCLVWIEVKVGKTVMDQMKT